MKNMFRIWYFIFMSLVIMLCFSMKKSVEMNTSGLIINSKNPEVVLVPAGEFVMGVERKGTTIEDKKKYFDDYSHKVRICTFYMDKYEITNYQYYKYCSETGAKLTFLWGMDKFKCVLKFPDHPIIGLSHYEASKYAEWRGIPLCNKQKIIGYEYLPC